MRVREPDLALAARPSAWLRLVGLALAVVAILFASDAAPGRAQQPRGLFEDARLVRWGAELEAGRAAALMPMLEEDLAGRDPYPLAAYFWVRMRSEGILPGTPIQAWAALPPGPARSRLELPVRIADHAAAGNAPAIALDMPDDAIDDATDLSSLLFAAWADGIDGARRERLFLRAAVLTRGELATPAIEIAALGRNLRELSRAALQPMSAETHRAVDGTALEPLLRALCGSHGGALDEVNALGVYLARNPRDPFARRRRAELLVSLERYGEAADEYAAMRRTWAFFVWNLESEAVALVRAGRDEQARRVVELGARVYGRAPEREAASFRGRWAETLRNAGEIGRARDELAPLVAADVPDAFVHAVMANIELSSGRATHAVPHARRAVAIDPSMPWAAVILASALRQAGELAAVPGVIASFRAQGGRPTYDMLSHATNAAIERGSGVDSLALSAAALVDFPVALAAQGDRAVALWKAGREDEALAFYMPAVEMRRTDWGEDRIVEWLRERRGDEAAAAWLESLAVLDPRDAHTWSSWANLHPGEAGRDQRLAIYDRAIAANPGWVWPITARVSVLFEAGRHDEALAGVESALALGGTGTDRADALNFLAWISHALPAHREADRALLERGLEATHEITRIGGAATLALYHRQAIFAALGRPQDAAEAALANAAAAPDSADAVTAIFNGSMTQAGNRAWLALDRVVARNPYEGRRLAEAAQYHAQWGGSAIIALRYAMWIRERSPESRNTSVESAAWGRLGDHVRLYERWIGAGSIAASDRYIGWFDGDRGLVLGSSSRASLSFDSQTSNRCSVGSVRPRLSSPGAPHAVLCDDEGNVVVREDDPVTGKPMLLQRGAAFVRCIYDARTHDAKRFEDSSGAVIELEYDAYSRITRITGNHTATTTIVYDERLGKPSRIEVEGTGFLDVTYALNGDIANVDSPAGRGVALAVTTTFQNLLAVTGRFDGSAADQLSLGFGIEDAELARLQGANEQAESVDAPAATRLSARLRIARYLTAHGADDPAYQQRAWDDLPGIVAQAARAPQQPALGLEALGLYLALARQHRPAGLTAPEMRTYDRLLQVAERWGASGASARPARALLEQIRRSPLRLREAEKWLPRSDFASQGYFRRYPLAELGRASVGIDRATAVLVRRNGDLVVGTNRGFSVRRRGFFEWFGFDEQRGVLTTDPSASLRASSEVRALAEDSGGHLWIGTANGLLRIDAAYDGPVRVFRTEADGMPVPGVDDLAELGSRVLVATARGLRCSAEGALVACAPELASEAITDLSEVVGERYVGADGDGAGELLDELEFDQFNEEEAPDAEAPTAEPRVVVTSVGAVRAIDASGAVTLLANAPAEHAVGTGPGGVVLLQRGRTLTSLPWPSVAATGTPATPSALATGEVQSTRAFHGLATMTTADGSAAPVVLTDRGLAFYRERHFEHLTLPLADRVPGVTAAAHRGKTGLFVSSDGVYVFERQAVHHFPEGGDDVEPVHALLTLPSLGVTFVGRGSEISVVRHDHVEEGPTTLTYGTHRSPLVRGRDGSVLFHSGDHVLAIEPRSGRTRELFAAPRRTNHQDFSRGLVRGLLVGHDGSVWVTVGSSLYHWTGRDGVPAKVFDFFETPAIFPARSTILSGLYEDVDGTIRVVASNEGHIPIAGVPMSGGLLEYDRANDRFRRVDELANVPWFVTGYTPIDERTALVGTLSGFARQTHGQRLPMNIGPDDVSYAALQRDHRSLMLGTRGVKLGDVWLFGSAEGVVAYRGGSWFYPDRLNWMLPMQQFATYGARVVHAVETDPRGRIYVGTDFGLTIYDSGGESSPAFLASNGRLGDAVAAAAGEQLRRETDSLLAGLPADHPLARRIAAVREEAARIATLEEQLAGSRRVDAAPTAGPSGRGVSQAGAGTSERGAADGAGDGARAGGSRAEVERELRRRRQEHSEALLRLERQEPGLFMMLSVPPLDLATVQRQIEPDEVVLQYIPANEKLFIQVLRRDGAELREVRVDDAELMLRARTAALRLAARSRPQAGAVAPGAPPRHRLGIVPLVTAGEPPLEDELAWLYDQLLRPVEDAIGGRDHVYVVASGALTYLPFAALVRTRQPSLEYAVERYAFASVSSIHLWQLMHTTTAGHGVRTLALADPDGTLPGARVEAASIARIAPESIVKLGAEASHAALEAGVAGSEIVMLATHGVLDGRRPELSYLLLADGYRLTMADAMVLPLDDVGMVVLSACESGVGSEGLEYATLARSFIHAGASSVVATLWRVPDAPSAALVGGFFRHLAEGDDRLLALARAQRDLLHGDERESRPPTAWAGYVLHGRR